MYIGTIFIGILNIFPKYLINYHGLYQSFKSLKWGTVESVLACYDHHPLHPPPPTLIFLPNLWFVSTDMSSADRYNSSFCFNNVEMKLNKKRKYTTTGISFLVSTVFSSRHLWHENFYFHCTEDLFSGTIILSAYLSPWRWLLLRK